MNLGDLKLKEISTFLDILETGSVRETARRLGLNASQITKSVQSLEHKLDVTLLERSVMGVRPTPEAEALTKFLREISEVQDALSGHYLKDEPQELAKFAANSFFSTHLLPPVFAKLERRQKKLRFRLVEVAPSQLLPVGLREGFHYCVHIGKLDWPKTWESVKVGDMRWLLCCRKGHPLTKKCTAKEVLKYPFVTPTYWANDGVRTGDDSCPIPISKRRKGHETATAMAAERIIRQSDHIAFLPEIVTREGMRNKQTVALKVSSWPAVKEAVYLTVKTDVVQKKRRDALVNDLRAELL